MKMKNEFELYFKKISKEILNIERITERKLTNEKSNENNNYILNKKFFYENKKKDEIKSEEINYYDSIRDEKEIKYAQEKNIEDNIYKLFQKVSLQIICSINTFAIANIIFIIVNIINQ